MSGLGCGFNRVDAWLLPDSGTEMSVNLSAAYLCSRLKLFSPAFVFISFFNGLYFFGFTDGQWGRTNTTY
jgi:hypothetical protein